LIGATLADHLSPYARLSLDGRSIIVTGAGSGIGAGTARLLAARGARLLLADRNEMGLAAVAREIADAGGEAEGFVVDITRPDEVAVMVAAAVARFGGLDGACNAAGVLPPMAPIEDIAPDRWARTIDILLTGTLICIEQEAEAMAGAGGAIVSIASAVALAPIPGLADYTAAKTALFGATHAVAAAYASRGLRANVVVPGTILTPMTAGLIEGEPAIRQAVLSGIPAGRLGDAADVAEAVAWLLSDGGAYVTGADLVVDGGQVLHQAFYM
jgi:NAD(P)-dependent dehydrogenase (short-subunit alcohol dehydrogenase family)